MYYSHPNTALALRAKWSFYNYTDLGFGSPRNRISCSQSSLYASFRNAKYLYYEYLLRSNPSLFQLNRKFIRLRVCDDNERLCKCCSCCDNNDDFELNDVNFERVEKEGFCSKKRENLAKYLSIFDDFDNNDDGYRKYSKREGFCGEKSENYNKNLKKDRNWKVFDRRTRDEEEKYNLSRNSTFSSDFEDQGVEKRMIVRKYKEDDDNGYSRELRNERSRKVFDRRAIDEEEKYSDRRDYNSKKNLTFSSGLLNRKDVSKKKGHGYGRVDDEEKVVREIRKYEDDEKLSKGSRSETNRKNFGHKIREEEENATYSSRRDLDRKAREEDYVYEQQEDSQKLVGSQRDDRHDKCSVGEIIDDCRRESYARERYSERSNYSQYGSNVRNMGKGDSSTSNVGRQNEIDKQVVRQADSRKSSLCNSNTNTASNLTSVKNLVDVTRNERTQVDQRRADKVDLNEYFETHISDSRIRESDTKNANTSKSSIDIKRDDGISLSSQRHLEEENVRRDEISSLVENLVQARIDERTQVNRQISNKMEISEQYTNQNTSRKYASGTETANSAKSSLRIREDNHEECSASELDSSVSDFTRSNIERVSNWQEESTMRIKSQQETSTSTTVQESIDNRRKRSQSTKAQIGTSSFLYQEKNDVIESASRLDDDSTSATVQQNIDNRQRRSQSIKAQIGTSSSLYQEKSDVIESASRLDESSSMYVGEFIDKLEQETSASDNHEETATITHESGRQSSLRSRNKGPSFEMWEIRGTTSLEPSNVEAKNDSSSAAVSNSNTSPGTPGNAITRRAHKSLWTYIADIMKIGLGHRSNTSTQKSGTRSSSNESISSEAWFSGQEPDEDEDDTLKKKNVISPKDSLPSKKTFERSRRVSQEEETDRSDIIIDQSLVPLRSSTSPSLGEIGNDNVHRSASKRSEEEFVREKVASTSGRHNEPEKRSGPYFGESTSMPIIRSAFSSRGSEASEGQRIMISSGEQSPIVTAAMVPPSISEIESIHIPSSELPRIEEITKEEKDMGIGGTEEREGELKRRKLQRNNQVLTQQFEEWEEAYKRESEQRKIDEFFMREALLEAKKAADTWEVPVGAVLVQNGKIIARGCNLVEELRDSTAHAEMICIREASNLLRSWRLPDTMLYVTLEPCAMCAGAILQARIDTVVWGAPNKLLGADGSWVRLFPNGDGGTSSNLSTSIIQNVGPVHPFHPKITVRRGILATECSDAMQQFFQLRRKKKINKQEKQSPPPSCLPMSTQPTKLFGKMHDLFAAMFCL